MSRLPRLPPAGDPVVFQSGDPSEIAERFAPYRISYFRSGTAALAAALIAAARRKAVAAPQVLLPGYGCPDLVSAAAYAGLSPVAVDFEPERPWLDLAAVDALLGPATVAIVAASLLGLPERLEPLQARARSSHALLIEDRAQAFPTSVDALRGDYVILSFGRGKPVSLLGGGAVLSRSMELAAQLPRPVTPARGRLSVPFTVSALVYNLLRSRWLYWLPCSLPGLHLGETRYHPLLQIEAMDPARLQRLGPAVRYHLGNGGDVQRAIASMLQRIPRVTDLAANCAPNPPRLLRYPILAPDAAIRCELVQRLSQAGLGVSTMYPSVLPLLPGVQGVVAPMELSHARAFAERLLTLPTHRGVTPRDLARMATILQGEGPLPQRAG